MIKEYFVAIQMRSKCQPNTQQQPNTFFIISFLAFLFKFQNAPSQKFVWNFFFFFFCSISLGFFTLLNKKKNISKSRRMHTLLLNVKWMNFCWWHCVSFTRTLLYDARVASFSIYEYIQTSAQMDIGGSYTINTNYARIISKMCPLDLFVWKKYYTNSSFAKLSKIVVP